MKGDCIMKIDLRIPGKTNELYIKCKKPEQLPIVLQVVSKFGIWNQFTDRSLYCKDCTLDIDELRNVIKSETEFTEKEVYVITPYNWVWHIW